jgi:hypothetical protein
MIEGRHDLSERCRKGAGHDGVDLRSPGRSRQQQRHETRGESGPETRHVPTPSFLIACSSRSRPRKPRVTPWGFTSRRPGEQRLRSRSLAQRTARDWGLESRRADFCGKRVSRAEGQRVDCDATDGNGAGYKLRFLGNGERVRPQYVRADSSSSAYQTDSPFGFSKRKTPKRQITSSSLFQLCPARARLA